MRHILIFAALSSLVGCADGEKDTAADDTGTTDSGTTDTGTTADVISSCNWGDVGLCYEYLNWSGTEAWCSDMATLYGFETSYAISSCGAGSVGSCSLAADAAMDDDIEFDTTAYYYAPDFADAAAADAACTSAGGTPM